MNGDYKPVTALFWMMGAVVSFVAMAIAGREISVEMNTFELMLYRSVIGFMLVFLLLLRSKRGVGQVKTARIMLHLWRNVVHFTGQNLWFFGIATIPLSQLVAIEFTSPIWVALLAALLLGEKMTGKKVVVAIMGFSGVLIVAQPGVQPIEWGHVAGLGAAFGFAMTTINTRKLMRYDSVLAVLFWMTLMQAVFALLLSLPGGIPWPSGAMWPWLTVVGFGGLSAHYCLTSALGLAPASVVAPMEFIRLPIIAIVGMVLYSEPLMLPVFIGGAVILAANLLNLHRR